MQAEAHATRKISISENCLKVLAKRYLKKDEKGKVMETPEEMFRRIAAYISSADKLYGANDREIKETFLGFSPFPQK